jgi:hypothetical protein
MCNQPSLEATGLALWSVTMEEKEKTIHDLKLHEQLKIKEDMYVMRVPGGWIYECENEITAVFVPWSSEFSNKFSGWCPELDKFGSE